jgi:hypothetical protein
VTLSAPAVACASAEADKERSSRDTAFVGALRERRHVPYIERPYGCSLLIGLPPPTRLFMQYFATVLELCAQRAISYPTSGITRLE